MQHHSSRHGQVNYVRNAVKATVDAYTGDVKLYGWDTKEWSARR